MGEKYYCAAALRKDTLLLNIFRQLNMFNVTGLVYQVQHMHYKTPFTGKLKKCLYFFQEYLKVHGPIFQNLVSYLHI